MLLRSPDLRFDRAEQTVYVHCPRPIHLKTAAEITAYFDESEEYWRKHVGAKVYYVVDITNLTINMREIDTYASNIRRTLTLSAITIVRYGGDSLQRTAGRLASLKLHTPSHLYDSLEEAKAVVRGLRAGTLALAEEA